MTYAVQTSRYRTAPLPTGFTLTELLVALFIIALMVGIAVPVFNRLTDVTRGDAGVTAVSTAVNAARIVGGRTPERDLSEVGGHSVSDEGMAALFTPSGEIRIVRHDPFAEGVDQNQYLAGMTPTAHGFDDHGHLSYVTVPRWASFAGVRRSGGELEFVPPPFAVRFDITGKLRSDGEMYYDRNGDGTYDTARDHQRYQLEERRPYDPVNWDAREADANVPVTADGRSHLPYDQIPVVTAVVLYEMRKFREDGASWEDDWAAPDDGSVAFDDLPELHQFLRDPERTRAVYFSPQTGLMVRGLSDRARN